MELTFWGVRGSFPVARPHVRRFGGNTSCLELQSQGSHLIIDAGTGIRALGQHLTAHGLGQDQPLHLLISHTHWDHIQGFPFFAPAYSEEYKLMLHSVDRPRHSLERLLSWQQDSHFFPVPLEQLKSKIEFSILEEESHYQIGPFKVMCLRLNHPGVSTGFRVETSEGVFAYVSDVAPSRDLLMAEYLEGDEQELLARLYDNQLRLADGADMVVYDTMFTPQEYRERKHWGHSTPDDGIEVCLRCKSSSLFLFHHNPEMTDEGLDEQVADYRQKLTNKPLALYAAQEGSRWKIRPGGVERCA
ncbi:MAG: MBL fold metallo-hydrolase [Vulcanimicrobiota bacterium]